MCDRELKVSLTPRAGVITRDRSGRYSLPAPLDKTSHLLINQALHCTYTNKEANRLVEAVSNDHNVENHDGSQFSCEHYLCQRAIGVLE